MTTSTIPGNEHASRSGLHRRSRGHRDVTTHADLGRIGLGSAGVVAIVVSAWGGIVPYIGPLFDYSGDGSGSWEWNMAHSLLALVPGVAGVLLGSLVLAEARGVRVGRGRLSLAAAGVLLMVCGAWFAIGPLAWPVVSDGDAYFVAGTHLRILAYEVGYSIGTGLLLAMCGAFVEGWASHHQTEATPTRGTMAATTTPASAPPAAPPVSEQKVESGI